VFIHSPFRSPSNGKKYVAAFVVVVFATSLEPRTLSTRRVLSSVNGVVADAMGEPCWPSRVVGVIQPC
jgi:hypothetical protein